MKRLWTLFTPKVFLIFGAVLFAIAGIDIWMRGCNDINVWRCMSWMGKICSAIVAIGVFGWALFICGVAAWKGLKWIANLVKL